jgi:hypothetical protein
MSASRKSVTVLSSQMSTRDGSPSLTWTGTIDLPAAIIGKPYSAILPSATSGDHASYTVGRLPTRLHFDAATRVLSGSPPAIELVRIKAASTDTSGSVTHTFPLAVFDPVARFGRLDPDTDAWVGRPQEIGQDDVILDPARLRESHRVIASSPACWPCARPKPSATRPSSPASGMPPIIPSASVPRAARARPGCLGSRFLVRAHRLTVGLPRASTPRPGSAKPATRSGRSSVSRPVDRIIAHEALARAVLADIPATLRADGLVGLRTPWRPLWRR